MGLHDYVQAFRRHLLLIAVFLAGGIGLALLGISRSHVTYTSTQSILVTGSEPSQDLNQIAADRISSYLAVARTGLVAGKVSTALEGKIPAGASYAVSAENPTGTSIITVKVTSPEAGVPQPVARQTVDQLITVVRDLEAKANKGGRPVATLVSIGDASTASPAGNHSSLLLVTGAALGLLFGAAGAVLRYRLDRSLHTAADAEVRLHHRVLGTVPRIRARSAGSPFVRGDLTASAAFRRTAQHVRRRLTDGQHRILVTSSVAGEGASVVANNLAAALADTGTLTVLVSAALRRDDGQAPIALAPGTRGEAKAVPKDTHVWHRPAQHGQLRVLAMSGRSGGRDQDDGDWILRVLRDVRAPDSSRMSVVVVDAGAALRRGDIDVLAAECTEIVLVVEQDVTQGDVVERTLSKLAGANVPVLGVVLNAGHRRRWLRLPRPSRILPARTPASQASAA